MNETLSTHILTKEEFIDRVKRNAGMIDLIDCFYMVHYYTEEFGEFESTLPRDVEMLFMFRRLIGKPLNEEDLYNPRTLKCRQCKEHRLVPHFAMSNNTSRKRVGICRFCDSVNPNAYEDWLSNEKRDSKMCRICNIRKKNIEFSLSRNKSLFDKSGVCNTCRKNE